MSESRPTEPEPPDQGSAIVRDRERSGVVYMLGVVAVVVVAGLAFWIGGNLAGIVVIVAMIALALTLGFRFERRGRVEVQPHPDDGIKRVLVLANEGLAGEPLERAIREHCGERSCHVHVVVPAQADAAKRIASDLDEARAGAQRRLEGLLEGLRGDGFERVEGEVGSEDPRLALEDTLRVFGADEVLVVNPADDGPNRGERSATERAYEDVPLPVTELRL